MRYPRTPIALAVLVLALLAAQPARGDDALPPVDFAKGTWTLSLYAGFDRECSNDPNLAYGSAGVGYFVMDHVSLNAEFRTAYVRQADGEDATLFELDLLLRHHVLRRDNWTLFVDVGGGISESTHRVPVGGTNFNYVLETGVGATYRIADGVHLIGGVRYWHLSNARLHGDDENPSANGVGGYVGLLFRL
ncbi:MAG TPA: acyloxyacyl hydrolase [Humisphaera sp.]